MLSALWWIYKKDQDGIFNFFPLVILFLFKDFKNQQFGFRHPLLELFQCSAEGWWPHTFYRTGVTTNELVRMLSQSQRTFRGLHGLNPSSNFVLPVPRITRPTTNLRLHCRVISIICVLIYNKYIWNISFPSCSC